jgi:hypothetical protein
MGRSPDRLSTQFVLIVAEAMHDAAADMTDLIAAIADELAAIWLITPRPPCGPILATFTALHCVRSPQDDNLTVYAARR